MPGPQDQFLQWLLDLLRRDPRYAGALSGAGGDAPARDDWRLGRAPSDVSGPYASAQPWAPPTGQLPAAGGIYAPGTQFNLPNFTFPTLGLQDAPPGGLSAPGAVPPGMTASVGTADPYLPSPRYAGPLAGGPPSSYGGQGGVPAAEGGYYQGTVMPGQAPGGNRREYGPYPGPAPVRPEVKDPLTLLDATSFDVLDLSKQLAAEQAKPYPDGNTIAMLTQRLAAAQNAQGNIVKYLDEKGEKGALDRWDHQFQSANLAWQIQNAAEARGVQVDQFAQSLGYNYAQLKQGADQFEQNRQDTFRKLGIEQGFAHEEKALDRSFQTEQAATRMGFERAERQDQNQFVAGQNEAQRGFTREERQDQNQFVAGQGQLGREHEQRMELLKEEFGHAEGQMTRDIQMKIAQMNDAIARGQLDVARANSEFDRWARTRQLELQGIAEENANRRFDKEYAQKERQFGQEMGFNVARADTEENRAAQQFKQGEHQFGAKMSEDQRQFNESFGQKRKGDAMAQLADLIRQGFATGGPEVQVGGGPGGSIGQIMASFGGDPNAVNQTYYKPAAPTAALSQITADLNAAPLTSTPYQEQQYQGSNALDQFRKMLTGG